MPVLSAIAPTTKPSVALPEIISALTFALDLTEGALPGHALRCCLIGMRIAKHLNLPAEQMTALYYALLLKDVGCSSNAARMTQMVGGDDRTAKSVARLAAWTGVLGVARRTVTSMWRNMLPEERWRKRAQRMIQLSLRKSNNAHELIKLRCERGSLIVRKLELGDSAAEAVHRLDEHWDGTGYPEGLHGAEIPLLARICTIAQHLDCFAMADGIDVAIHVVRKRSGAWFDPAIVGVAEALHTEGRLWIYCRPECPVEVTRRAVMDIDPGSSAALGEAQIDAICEAFADVVDAKSPFTYRHSQGVADVAESIANEMGLAKDRVQLVRRAALLHDLGKLAVPNTILDKNAALTDKERAVVHEHPFLTRTVLERITSFEELAIVAGEHHEKLDGSGYPLGIGAEEIRVESRVIAVADCFAALAEERPYRKAMDIEAILEIIAGEVPKRLDGACLEALRRVTDRWAGRKPASLTTPMTGEVCALRPRRMLRRHPHHSREMKAVS